MQDEYNFNNGKRGIFYSPDTKHLIPVYLESEIIDYYTKKANDEGIELEIYLNALLRAHIAKTEKDE